MTAHASFEPDDPGTFEGLAEVEVMDPDPAALPPPTIIQTDHGWEIRVKWSIKGSMVPWLVGNPNLEWKVSAYAEGLGAAADEKQLGSTQTVNFTAGSGPGVSGEFEYNATISVPASAGGGGVGLVAGAYRLVTIILAEDAGTPKEAAAFVEGPVIQLYEA